MKNLFTMLFVVQGLATGSFRSKEKNDETVQIKTNRKLLR